MLNQNSLFLILAAPAAAWVSGMGLFKTLLVMIIMHRWVPGGHFAGPLEVLSQDWVLYVIGVMAAVEVVADLVPRWDIHWDRWNVYPRVLGAIIISWMLLASEDVFSKLIMATVGAALAITSFTAKTSARRAAIRGHTAPFVAPVSSVTENCLIASALLPLTQLPPMTLLLVLFMAMAAMLIIYVVRDESRETFQWIFKGKWVEPYPRSSDDSGLPAKQPLG